MIKIRFEENIEEVKKWRKRFFVTLGFVILFGVYSYIEYRWNIHIACKNYPMSWVAGCPFH